MVVVGAAKVGVVVVYHLELVNTSQLAWQVVDIYHQKCDQRSTQICKEAHTYVASVHSAWWIELLVENIRPEFFGIQIAPNPNSQQADREGQAGPSSLGGSDDGGSHGRAALIKLDCLKWHLYVGGK